MLLEPNLEPCVSTAISCSPDKHSEVFLYINLLEMKRMFPIFCTKHPQKSTGMFSSSICISSLFLLNYSKLHFLTDYSPILQMSVLLYGYPDGTEPPVLFGSYHTLVNVLLLVYIVSSILTMLVCKEGCFVPCSHLYCSVITFGTFLPKKNHLYFQ